LGFRFCTFGENHQCFDYGGVGGGGCQCDCS
jgi:hypothetical protein